MLNLIFQKRKTTMPVYVDSRTFFSINKKETWFTNKVVQIIMDYVDGTKLVEGFVLKDRLGRIIPPEYLSTGSKTAILIWLYPEIVFNVTQCGDNAFKCVADFCQHCDRTVLTYRYLPERYLSRLDLQKDGTSFELDDYDDLVDGWLEEKYND